MSGEFRRGDRVEWRFRGQRVTGKVQRKLTSRADLGGRPIAASKDDPRYVVKTDKTGKETARRPIALRKLRGSTGSARSPRE